MKTANYEVSLTISYRFLQFFQQLDIFIFIHRRACGAYGGGESFAQGFGGEAGGNETTGETQT
jgi:hypothetical protein